MWWPDVVVRFQKSNGMIGASLLKQIAMSGAIRKDESIHDSYWRYKAEVSFDMRPWRANEHPPVPFLSSSEEVLRDPLRRHSWNPFPLGAGIIGRVRRPDVVIVKDESNRWPGRGTTDQDGTAQTPNLLRLVEVKFPGDGWGKGQENDYVAIAGDNSHMTVLKVSGGEERAKELVEAAIAAGFLGKIAGKLLLRARIRSKTPIPQPAWFEPWSALEGAAESAANGVAALWDTAAQGARELSDATQAWLHESAQWLFHKGRWVADGAGREWHYVDAESRTVWRYTMAQLKTGWQQISQQTDLTVAQLVQIDWGQVCITAAKGVVVVALVIAGVTVAIVLAQVLVGVLAALVAIASTVGGAAMLAELA
jgi:hypothetical protein